MKIIIWSCRVLSIASIISLWRSTVNEFQFIYKWSILMFRNYQVWTVDVFWGIVAEKKKFLGNQTLRQTFNWSIAVQCRRVTAISWMIKKKSCWNVFILSAMRHLNAIANDHKLHLFVDLQEKLMSCSSLWCINIS